MDILAFDFASLMNNALHVLYVAVGLGLVIFFHELGHFAVAKWCGVFVERFSIGFGPILWSFKRGETEYALSAVPFGGYVKMLGQDDMDPSQLTSEEIARDPRAYSNKTVAQRMAIISAGVIMNIITGCLFYMGAFKLGVDMSPPQVGTLQIGKPAWQKGLRLGDTLTHINSRELRTFPDILRGITLSVGETKIAGRRLTGESFEVTIAPDPSGERRMIGVGDLHLRSMTLNDRVFAPDQSPFVMPGTAAEQAKPAFAPKDTVLEISGQKLNNYFELIDLTARRRSETLEYLVQRGNEQVKIEVPPQKFLDLGMWFDIERVAAIQDDSPAAKAKLQVGDKITKVNGEDVGTKINPLFLADYFESLAGQEIEVQVKRSVDTSPDPVLVTLMVVPTSAPAWTEQPDWESMPLSIPSIGLAYHLTSVVSYVDPEGIAAKAGITQGATLKSMKFESKNAYHQSMLNDKNGRPVVAFTDPKKNVAIKNTAHCLWRMQTIPEVSVTLEFTDDKTKPVKLTPERTKAEHYLPRRGPIHQGSSIVLLADSFGDAMSMGVDYTRGSAIDIYLTLRGLFGGHLSVTNLSGPLQIAKNAYLVSQDGLSKLLLFLGFLSVNLAVLNFLPIPLLDGGHMVFLIWEGVTRRRPHPRVLEYAQICGFVFVIGLMIFVICLDLFVHR